MTEPELLASGSDRRLPPVLRKTVPVAVALALAAAVVALLAHSAPAGSHPARPARPGTTPVALPSTGPGPAAAPVTADLAHVVVDPATHRLRLVFTVFNQQTSRVVLLRVGADSPGLAVRRTSFGRFAAGGSFHPARLPMVLAPAQSAHVSIDYGVRRCPSPNAVRLRVPAVLASRERGRMTLDLAALVPPGDWPRGLITLLCPASSR